MLSWVITLCPPTHTYTSCWYLLWKLISLDIPSPVYHSFSLLLGCTARKVFPASGKLGLLPSFQLMQRPPPSLLRDCFVAACLTFLPWIPKARHICPIHPTFLSSSKVLGEWKVHNKYLRKPRERLCRDMSWNKGREWGGEWRDQKEEEAYCPEGNGYYFYIFSSFQLYFVWVLTTTTKTLLLC